MEENSLYRMHLINKTISSNTIFEQLSDGNLLLHKEMVLLKLNIFINKFIFYLYKKRDIWKILRIK